jgi:hypothetical protein
LPRLPDFVLLKKDLYPRKNYQKILISGPNTRLRKIYQLILALIPPLFSMKTGSSGTANIDHKSLSTVTTERKINKSSSTQNGNKNKLLKLEKSKRSILRVPER